jgi:hypothetical protein
MLPDIQLYRYASALEPLHYQFYVWYFHALPFTRDQMMQNAYPVPFNGYHGCD